MLTDLEIDALAFGVRNNLSNSKSTLFRQMGKKGSQGKNRFIDFLANYQVNIGKLSEKGFNKKKKDHYKKVQDEKREIFFTTNYSRKLADEIRLFRLENEKLLNSEHEKKWYRFENPLSEIEQFKDERFSKMIRIMRLAVCVFLREGGWIRKE